MSAICLSTAAKLQKLSICAIYTLSRADRADVFSRSGSLPSIVWISEKLFESCGLRSMSIIQREAIWGDSFSSTTTDMFAAGCFSVPATTWGEPVLTTLGSANCRESLRCET